MSEVARRERTAREIWAAPGSSHDRLVAIARVALPMSIGVLAAFLVMAPLTATGDVSFVLDKNKVEVARERLKIQTARYSGQDTKGQPFQLTAGSAIQKSSAEPVVRLNQLKAGIQLADGPAQVVANTGRYDMDTETVKLDGPIAMRAAGGYRLDTHDATLNLKSRQMQSQGGVSGTVPQGNFRGDTMRADLENRTVTIDGNARLRIVPRGAR
ncbi:LPS export ABC transporter periplasmic protein LptC [Sphingomonas sp. Leaf343]|uniref:LPS export ABC transporter periplasmic protein LptC n=1 Tax=Sphingomonas sp. Leaf343 TaxID=1736345 RepID=UPI0006F9462C|nr:LPS export ABC transporter periplasmic protein LptC [Sphingomonas sp. Leaf343]KQR80436.1 LPS export ABC transporter periplasmic protein LptC [Sphingomonas sp. Leaf343]